ncbi:MAG: hypothetical protein A4S09_04895 [Proteobacteria bacterium SG_bin7]|nr:MAG: hypothetical protein A4S09_04895 [Proteobacteria bacterium SG_bin7]
MSRLVVVLFILSSLPAWSKTPSWVKDATKRNGSQFTTVCSGIGPSIDSARGEAIASCRASAIDETSPTATYKSVTIETDKEVALHNSIESSAEFKNLHCQQLNEQIEELEGQFKIWLKCKFDLNKVVKKETEKSISTRSLIDAEKIQERTIASKEVVPVEESRKSILLSVIPACDELLIKSSFSRIVTCKENPIQLVVTKSDSEIIIRRKGYKPKTLKIKEIMEVEDEAFVIHLDNL